MIGVQQTKWSIVGRVWYSQESRTLRVEPLLKITRSGGVGIAEIQRPALPYFACWHPTLLRAECFHCQLLLDVLLSFWFSCF